MNRRKKLNQILKSKAKKANAKANPKQKPRYIAKADRTEEGIDTSAEQSSTS